MRRSSISIVVTSVSVVVLLAGCFGAGAGSSQAPTFGGVSSAVPDGISAVDLSWTEATDDVTPSADITYSIWVSSSTPVDTSGDPDIVTQAGVTQQTVPVAALRDQYFLVRATDADGNEDANVVEASAATTQATWNFLDGGGAADSVYFASDSVSDSALEELNGTLYAAWADGDSGVVRTASWDGDSTWAVFDDLDLSVGGGAPVAGISRQRISLTGFSDRLYVAWSQNETATTTVRQIQVAMYDPAAPANGWQFVDGNASGGLNSNVAENATHPALVVVDGALFAVWEEAVGGGSDVIFAAEYNGNDSAPSWSLVTTGETYNPAHINRYPDAIDFEGDLLVVWTQVDIDSVRLRRYDPDGDAWTDFDSGGLFAAAGSSQSDPRLAVIDSTPYVVWIEDHETTTRNQLRASARIGGSWVSIDGDGANGLNYDPTQDIFYAPAPLVINGTLYVVTAEEESATTNAQIRVIAWDGDPTTPGWSYVDGGGSLGLNANTIYPATHPAAAPYGGGIAISWAEETGSITLRALRAIGGR